MSTSQSEYYSNPDLMLRAKSFLGGKYKRVISMTLSLLLWEYMFMVLDRMLTSILQAGYERICAAFRLPADGTGIPALVLSLADYAIVAVLTIFTGMFLAGMALYYLKLTCGQEFTNFDLLYGFREEPGKVFGVSAGIQLPGILAALPYFLLRNYELLRTQAGASVPDWMSGAVLAAFVFEIVVTVFAYMGLGLSFFLMLDFPRYSAGEVLKLCWNKMRGHKWRFFCLHVRFLPLILLGVLSLGIGMLWIYPLLMESYACFFLDLVNPNQKFGFDHSV